jgi:hypothetical protein
MSIQECQQKHTSTDFLDSVAFCEIEEERELEKHTRQDHQLAHIIVWLQLIYYSWTGQRKTASYEDALIKFKEKEEITTRVPDKARPVKRRRRKRRAAPTQEQRQRAEQSKNTWVQWAMANRTKKRMPVDKKG